MRWLVLLMLAGCELSLSHPGGGGTSCDSPPPGPSCSCSNNQWFCNTCPFFEGAGSVACSQPGRGCSIETWEHGCDCTCGSDGWWYCTPETIGSRCPSGMPDAGVPEPIPDAAVDAGPCQSIEAEWVGDHTGWFEVSGPPSGGRGLQSLQATTTFTFQFTGTSVAMTYLRGPSDGEISISIDGGASIIVAAHYAVYDWVTAPLASGLANAAHTVSVTCNAPQCSIDTFPVSCN
ncbi:MAG TPA: hypothetical protein VIV40_12500 [Kofleriaceae bacterium]